MSFSVLQYITAADFCLFAIICTGTGSFVKKAWAERVFSLINDQIKDHNSIPTVRTVLRKAIENASSPFTVLGDFRALLFFLSLFAFAMFSSQAVSSFIVKIMDPSGDENIIYTFACVFGVAYVLVAIIFLLVENTWRALFTHVTLGSLRDARKDD